jgi:glutamine synthetase
MLLVPDPSRYWLDAFMGEKTLCLIADVIDPITREGYWLDPRGVGRRAENYLKFTGIADTVYFGPEAEFFVFDEVHFHNDGHTAGYSLDSPEAIWNTNGQNGNGNKGITSETRGLRTTATLDTPPSFRGELLRTRRSGFNSVSPPRCHSPACEIDFRYRR